MPRFGVVVTTADRPNRRPVPAESPAEDTGPVGGDGMDVGGIMNSQDGVNEGRAIGVARVVGPAAVGVAGVGTAGVGTVGVGTAGVGTAGVAGNGARPGVKTWVIGLMAAAAVAVG